MLDYLKVFEQSAMILGFEADVQGLQMGGRRLNLRFMPGR
jgi:hypothetical protein